MTRRHLDPLRLSLAAASVDVLCVILAATIAWRLAGAGAPGEAIGGALVMLTVASVCFANLHAGLYVAERLLAGRIGVRLLLGGWLSASGLPLLATLTVGAIAAGTPVMAVRGGAVAWVATMQVVYILLAIAGRGALAQVIVARDLRRRAATRIAVVGTAGAVRSFCERLGASQDRPMHLVAVLGDHSAGSADLPASVEPLTDLDALVALVRRSAIDQVVIAQSWPEPCAVEQIVRHLSATPVDIRLTPLLAVGLCHTGPVTHVGGMPLLALRDSPMASRRRLLKKIEDMSVAVLLLLALGPLMLLAALLIRLDSPGPALFRQVRYGLNNRRIVVLKFRTMRADEEDPQGRRQATRHDHRVTRVGRILRSLSIDELPQLINVLRGEMSMVGPRPHAMATLAAGLPFEEADADYLARHQVKPGVTGWAQVNGWRGETDSIGKLQKRIEFDLYYIRNWSLWFDLLILLRTVGCVLGDRNAY